jgi:hypothetical protein
MAEPGGRVSLASLRPRLHDRGHALLFCCPVCPDRHTIRVPIQRIGKPYPDSIQPQPAHIWLASGELAELTLQPSLNVTLGCAGKFHGWIKDGEVSW